MWNIKHTLHVLPIHVINSRLSKERSVFIGEELESLISTLGGKIVNRVIQKIYKPNNATYIGQGKILEVSRIVKRLIGTFVLYNFDPLVDLAT